MTAVVRDGIALPNGDVGETRAPTTDERTGELPFLRRPCFARPAEQPPPERSGGEAPPQDGGGARDRFPGVRPAGLSHFRVVKPAYPV